MLDRTDIVRTIKERTAHAMSTTYALSAYNCVKSDTPQSVNEIVSWRENVLYGSSSFVGMVHVYTEKSAPGLKANAIGAYSVHLVMLNVLRTYCRNLFGHGHTVVALLLLLVSEIRTNTEDTMAALKQLHMPFSAVVPLSDKRLFTNSRGATYKKLRVLQRAVHKILEFLTENAREGVSVFYSSQTVDMPSNNNFRQL